ncbi:MAG: hypothetical protein ACPL28_09110 [bacterium]
METQWLSFVIPIAAIVMGCLIAVVAIIMGSFEKKKYYDAATKAIEAGKSVQEIKEILGNLSEKKWHHYHEGEGYEDREYLKTGIITLGVGVGGVLFGLIQTSRTLVGIGIFIGIIGFCFLILHFFQIGTQKS